MIFMTKIRTFMEHNLFLAQLVPQIQKSGVPRLIRDICEPFQRNKGKADREAFSALYQENRDKFDRVRRLLEDDLSRKTFDNVIRYRLAGGRRLLKQVLVQPQYFQKDIFTPRENEVFVDGGGYIGDTIISFIDHFAVGDRWNVYTWEPDEDSISVMNKIFRQPKFSACKDRIHPVRYGMWSEATVLKFKSTGGTDTQVSESGDTDVPVNSIDNIHRDHTVTLIKMDIEGAETEALRGAEMVIRRDKPRLAICIYHRPTDLFEIPLLIKEMVPEYKLYVRHHADTVFETVIYATL